MKINREWYKSFFQDSFYNPASPAALKGASKEVRFLLKLLKLKKGAKLLDLCCGPGRHSILLAKKGLNVAGCDFSNGYLRQAAQKAKKAGVKLRLVRRDMRRLRFRGEFEAVINLFTSFGYFQRRSDDLKTLKGVVRALKPGGLFLMDIIHGDYVRGNFRPRNWARLEDGSYRLEETVFHRDGVANAWTAIKKGKVRKRSFFLRLYTRKTISSALIRSGMKPLKFWGSFLGDPLSDERSRLIVLAQKPVR